MYNYFLRQKPCYCRTLLKQASTLIIFVSVPKRHCDSCKHSSYFHSVSLVFIPQKKFPKKVRVNL